MRLDWFGDSFVLPFSFSAVAGNSLVKLPGASPPTFESRLPPRAFSPRRLSLVQEIGARVVVTIETIQNQPKMEQYGNTSTFNVESVLSKNVTGSEYWRRTASKLATVESLIDQIYYDVDHVEPWMAGRSSRGASSAFCLLHRLGELVPTSSQIKTMLDHRDSPYIRAVSLLYLRFVANPRTLWQWFEGYLSDGEELSPSPSPGGGEGEGEAKTVTVGVFARELLLDPFYFETIFPRIPKPVADDIEAKLRAKGFSTKAMGNAGLGGPGRRSGAAQPSSVKSALMVSLAQRAPNRRGPGGNGGGGGGGGGGGSRDRRDGSRDRRRGDGDRYNDRRRDDDLRGRDDRERSYRRSRSRSRSPSYRRREDHRDRDRDYRGGREGYTDRR